MNTPAAASPWVHCTVDGRSVRVAAGTNVAAALAHGGDGVARQSVSGQPRAPLCGMGMSGANIKGATEYGQNMGSQEYQNAFNRYQINRTNQLAPLQGLYSGGQASAAGSAAQAGALGQNLGQTYTNLGQGLGQAAAATGNANASAYINSGNAFNNALNSGLSSYMGYNNMQAYNARTAAMAG